MDWARYQDSEEAAVVKQQEAEAAGSLQARWAAAPPLHACPPEGARQRTVGAAAAAHEHAAAALEGHPQALAEPLLCRNERLQVRVHFIFTALMYARLNDCMNNRGEAIKLVSEGAAASCRCRLPEAGMHVCTYCSVN